MSERVRWKSPELHPGSGQGGSGGGETGSGGGANDRRIDPTALLEYTFLITSTPLPVCHVRFCLDLHGRAVTIHLYALVPHGTADSTSDIQSKLQTLGNKTDIKITQVVQTTDKISGMPEPKFRFDFEVGSNFSPFGLYKFAKINLSAGESKVLLNPEVCENYDVHRECLKLLNGRSETVNLTADKYCSCSLARSTGGSSTKAQTSAAQTAFAERHKKRKVNAVDPFA